MHAIMLNTHTITYLKLLRNYTILINIAKVMCSCHLTSKAIDYCGFSISCQFFQPSIDFGNSGVCWWEKPLVVALKHSEGIKHTVLFQQQKLTIN